jgi:hypothetical protein
MDRIEELSERDLFERAIQLLEFAESILEKYLAEREFAGRDELIKLLTEKGFAKDEAEKMLSHFIKSRAISYVRGKGYALSSKPKIIAAGSQRSFSLPARRGYLVPVTASGAPPNVHYLKWYRRQLGYPPHQY